MKAMRIGAAVVVAMAFGGVAMAQGTGSTGTTGSAPAATATPAPAATPAASTSSAASGDVKVEAKACKSVVNRECQDGGDSFSSADGSVSLWTKVTGLTGGGTLHHVWFKGDEQMGDVELKIGGTPWRTYSKKTINGEMKGDWRVEVRDAGGAVLETVKFKVD